MKRALAVIVLAGLVLACSSSGNVGNTTAPATDVTAFGNDYCNLLEPCCADAGLSTTGQTCRAFVTVAAGQGPYNATAGQACIQALQAASGNADFCTNLGGNPTACKQVFSKQGGMTQPGQPCTQDNDCAPAANGGAICFTQFNFVDGGSSQTQTCIQTTYGQAGDSPCIGTVNGNVTEYGWGGAGAPPSPAILCDVSKGVSCDSKTMTCVAPAAVGQPCTSDSSCVTSAYCDFGTSTCQARLADGSMCTGASTCQMTSYCDTTSHTCTAGLANGAACMTSQSCQSHACINGMCAASGSGGLGLTLLCGKK